MEIEEGEEYIIPTGPVNKKGAKKVAKNNCPVSGWGGAGLRFIGVDSNLTVDASQIGDKLNRQGAKDAKEHRVTLQGDNGKPTTEAQRPQRKNSGGSL